MVSSSHSARFANGGRKRGHSTHHNGIITCRKGTERCPISREPALTIRSVAGNQPVTNGWPDSPGMRHISRGLRPGILVGRSRQ